jgi:tetratricopeptide (TPR) repeat protein
MQLEADKEVASLDAARQKKSSADMQAFVTDLFKSADPVGLSGLGLRKARSQMSLREVLDYGAQAAADRLADQPLVQASLQETLGNIDRSVGNYERAEELLTKSAATRRGLLPADDPELARSQFHLGWLRQDQGRLEEAETIFRKCLAIQIKHYGEEHLDVAATKFNLGWLLTLHYEEGTGVGSPRIKEAIQLLQASLQTRRDLLGDAHPLVADTLIGLGFACYGTEERSEYGLKLTLQAAEIFGARGEKDHLVINLQKLLKVQNLRNQDKPRAIALLKEVVAEARIILGNEHFMTAMALGHLAGIQREVNDFDGAEASIREALAIGRKVFPKGHPLMIEALQELARHLRERGNEAESADLLREAEVIAKRFLRPESSLRQRIEEDIAKFAPRGK